MSGAAGGGGGDAAKAAAEPKITHDAKAHKFILDGGVLTE